MVSSKGARVCKISRKTPVKPISNLKLQTPHLVYAVTIILTDPTYSVYVCLVRILTTSKRISDLWKVPKPSYLKHSTNDLWYNAQFLSLKDTQNKDKMNRRNKVKLSFYILQLPCFQFFQQVYL